MAKQSKKAIDQRKAELITAGYTEEELSRPDHLHAIENATSGNWPGVLLDMKTKKEESLIPITPSENVPHEEGDKAEDKGPGTTLVVTMDVTKDVAALTVDTNKEAIELWVKTYAGLKFTTLDDVDTITKIREGKKLAQKCRIAVTKRETFLKAPYIAGSKKIKEVADEYVALLAKIEDPLDAQIELIKAAEEADKLKKAAEAEAEGTRRVEVLKDAGMKFDGQFYCIGDGYSLDYASVKAKTPEDFEKFVILVQNEKTRLDDLAAKELEQMKVQRLQTRGNMLVSIGMITLTEGGAYGTELLPGVTVLNECLTNEPDDKFMVLFSSLSGRIAEAKKRAEDEKTKKAKERTVNMRSKLIIAAGLNRVDWIPGTTQTGFYFKNDFTECKLLLPEVESLEDEAFDGKLNEFETLITEAKTKAVKKEADDKAAELLAKDRREQLVALGMTAAPKVNRYIFNMPDVDMECYVDYEMISSSTPEAWETTIELGGKTIAKIQERQKEFEDNAAKEKGLAERYQQRLLTLTGMGMKLKGEGEFIFSLPTIERDAITTIEFAKGAEIPDWDSRIGFIVEEIKEIKQAAEDKAAKILSIFTERQYKLVNLGMVIVDQKFFRIGNEFQDVSIISIEEVKVIDEDTWPRRLQELTAQVEEVKKLTMDKRQEAANKLEAAKPQAEKLKDYLMALLSIDTPVIEDPELSVILVKFEEVLADAMGEASAAIERKINAANKELAAV